MSGFERFQVSMFKRVGNNGNFKVFLFYLKSGQADTVQANGSFFDDQFGEGAWKGNLKFPAAVLDCFTGTCACGIHMPLNKVSVQAAIHYQATFEVNQ